MTFWIQLLILAVSSLSVLSETCPSDQFSAVITASLDQTIDDPFLPMDDPELSYFKTIMKFREATIQHVTEDAIDFFNNEYGLDFSNSVPNEQHQRVFQNATMRPYLLPPDELNIIATYNRWIYSGSTHSTCYFMRIGGFLVTFSGEQILFGSYGGAEGKPIEKGSFLAYGFYNIDVCKQSPIIIQFQTRTPVIRANADGTMVSVFNLKLYNRVLGHGQAVGILQVTPNPDDPEKFHATIRNTMTFPAESV